MDTHQARWTRTPGLVFDLAVNRLCLAANWGSRLRALFGDIHGA